MFQGKIYKIFEELPDMFGIVDDILSVCYDSSGAEHDIMLYKVIQICRKN